MAKSSSSAPLLGLLAAFCVGFYAHYAISPSSAAPPAPPPRAPWEERGPPTKQELGQAGWTLLHTIAANFPEQPNARQMQRMESFLHALGDFYPCEVCASHFRRHTAANPVAVRTRSELSMWMCSAHNEVNLRNGKEAYYCDLGVLDARWKDCGCGHNATSPAAPPRPRRRKMRGLAAAVHSPGGDSAAYAARALM